MAVTVEEVDQRLTAVKALRDYERSHVTKAKRPAPDQIERVQRLNRKINRLLDVRLRITR